MTEVAAPPLRAAINGDPGLRRKSAQERKLKLALNGLGGLHAATGAVALFAPGLLFRTIDGFGIENDHFIRHVGTIDLALGGVLLVAARTPRWRLPTLAAATAQSALHLAIHLFDGETPDPPWVRYLDDAMIAGVTWLLAWSLATNRRLEGVPEGCGSPP